MRLQHAVDIGFGTEFDVISSLENVDPIVSLEEAIIGNLDSHASEFSLNVFTDQFEKTFGRFACLRSARKVVNLSAYKDLFTINGTGVEVSFMAERTGVLAISRRRAR